MERKETAMIMQVLETAYPQFYGKQDTDTRKSALRLWHDMFAEDSGVEVGAAVKAFIATDTKGFPPSIGQIKTRLVQLKAPDMLDEAQAWSIVSKAIQNSAYHAREEFEKLPAVIRSVVRSPSMLKDWALSDGDTLQTVIASNFQRAYRTRAAQAKEYLALPSNIQQVLEQDSCFHELPEAPDTQTQAQEAEKQKQKAMALLLAEREEEWESWDGKENSPGVRSWDGLKSMI